MTIELTEPVRPPFNTTRLNRSCGIAASCSPRWRTSAAATGAKSKRPSARARPDLGAKTDGLQLLSRAEGGLEQLDTALDRSALAAPQIKMNLIEACVRVVGADGLIQEREAQLLRAGADTLDCPIPPFVETAEA